MPRLAARKGDRLAARIGRWFRHSSLAVSVGSGLGALYIRLVLKTTRWEVMGREHHKAAVSHRGGVIGAVWHGRLGLAPYWLPPGRLTVGMISGNRDGELIAAVLSRFGVRAVRGSSYDRRKQRDKGGAKAFAEAQEALMQDAVVVMTPDGPRGPLMRAQPGIAQLAVRTGAPVYPITFSTRRGWVARSWDRFLLPYPFGRGVQIMGAGLEPPTDQSASAVESFRLEIENALTKITHEADRVCHRAPVEPASPAAA